MKRDDFMFGVSGFRGRVGESFEPTTILRFSLAFASLVRDRGGQTVLIGRDPRPSGEMASYLVAAGLLASGLEVIEVGIAPTPTVLHAAKANGTAGAIMVTASHNPPEWNGLEFALEGGRLLTPDERGALKAAFDEATATLAGWDAQGAVQPRHDALELHLSRIMALAEVNLTAIEERKPKVVLDAGNGAGSIISPSLLQRLGCEVIRVHCEPNGTFPRSPEPTEESLDTLRETVVREGADLGLAHDFDADRLVVVDEKGNLLSEEYTLAFVADTILRRTHGTIVTTVVTGRLIDEVAASHGATVVRTAVGVGNVVRKMEETNAAVGGESTGGVIVRGTHLTTDGVAAIAIVVSGLVESGGTVSEWAARWKRYHTRRAKTPLPSGEDISTVLDRIAAAFSDAEIDRLDGIKLNWNDAWLAVRPSGTEPVLRIFAESVDRARAEALLQAALDRIG